MLHIRPQNAKDLDFLYRILQREAHAHPLPMAGEEETAYAQAAAFTCDADKGALIYEDAPSGQYVGAALYRCRNRNEECAPGEIFAQLESRLFPAGGGFLETVLCWINPDYRRLGLGSELLAQLEQEARRRDIHLVYLHTEGKNIAGKRFARKMAYREVFRGPMWDDTVRVGLVKRV